MTTGTGRVVYPTCPYLICTYPIKHMTLSNDRDIENNNPDIYQISLLEEKLQVARRQEKIGEVVIRKEVETRMVKLPIRREKLIVERVGENPELLTEVIVGEETINGFKYGELAKNDLLEVSQSRFVSLATAKELLAEISKIDPTDNSKIRLEIVTNSDNQELQSKIAAICQSDRQF